MGYRKASRKSYTAGYKLKVLQYAKQHGNRVTERKFGVSETLVRDWRKKEDRLLLTKKSCKADRGMKPKWPDLEKKMAKWLVYERQRSENQYVSHKQIYDKAIELSKELGIQGFEASKHWCYRFFERNNLHPLMKHISANTLNAHDQTFPVQNEAEQTQFVETSSDQIQSDIISMSENHNSSSKPNVAVTLPPHVGNMKDQISEALSSQFPRSANTKSLSRPNMAATLTPHAGGWSARVPDFLTGQSLISELETPSSEANVVPTLSSHAEDACNQVPVVLSCHSSVSDLKNSSSKPNVVVTSLPGDNLNHSSLPSNSKDPIIMVDKGSQCESNGHSNSSCNRRCSCHPLPVVCALSSSDNYFFSSLCLEFQNLPREAKYEFKQRTIGLLDQYFKKCGY